MREKLIAFALLAALAVALVAGQAYADTKAVTPGHEGQAQEFARVGTVTVRLPLIDEAAKRFGPDAVIEDLPLCVTADGTLAVLMPRELDVFGQKRHVVGGRQVVNLSELRYEGGGWLTLPFAVSLE